MKTYQFELFQVNDHNRREKGFLNLEDREAILDDATIYLKDYDLKYSDYVEGNNEIEALENLFRTFNIDHPNDFNGRSLSVSDIVKLDDVFYFCDSFGWKVVELI